MIAAMTMGLLFQAAAFVPLEYPGAEVDMAPRITGICGAPPTADRGALLTREERLSYVVRDARDKATAPEWGYLACARAHLAAVGALSRESYLMNAGSSWIEGALDAARRAVTIRANEPQASDLLAALALGDPNLKPLAEVATLMRASVDAGNRSPLVLRACSDFAIRTGNRESTIRCATLGLAQGSDSTWHLLRLARQDYRDDDSLGAVARFALAAISASDSVARLDVEWHLQWFISPEERAGWNELPDSARAAWAQDRLLERDVRDGRPPGSRVIEHFRRLEFVETNFRMAVPRILRDAARSGAGVFMSADSLGTTRLTQFAESRRWQVDFDDRGVTWMRFGRPEKIAGRTAKPTQPGSTTWLYKVDGLPMLVHFEETDYDGSSGDTRFSVGTFGFWHCGLDAYRCNLALREESRIPIGPEVIQRLREQDREAIAIATTKDDNSVRGMEPIQTVASLYQLWDGLTAEPMAVLAYGVRLNDLAVSHPDTGEDLVHVQLAFSRWHPHDATWHQDSLEGIFNLPTQKTGETFLSAFRIFPDEAGVSTWGLTAAQEATHWGRAYAVTTPLDPGPLAISDLVLAPESRGLSWVHRGERIFLSPGGKVRRDEPLHIFYQMRSDGPRVGLTTTIELFRVRPGVTDTVPMITLSFKSSIQDGITGVNRELDLSNVPSGSFRIEVRIADRAGALVGRRGAIIAVE